MPSLKSHKTRRPEREPNRVCLNCQTRFYEFPSYIEQGRGIYCSRDCKRKHRQVEKTCFGCRSTFRIQRNQAENWERNGVKRWWCSSECKTKVLYEKRICPVCQQNFTYQKSSKKAGVTCSAECKKKYQSRPEGDENIKKRFWSKVVNVRSGCQIFNGVAEHYQEFYRRSIDGGRILAHIFSFQIHHGAIPEGHVVRHTCDVPGCVQPDHLLSGTPKENSQDMVARNRVTRNNACLTEDQVKKIREEESRNLRPSEIAKKYRVSYSVIWKVLHRRTWKNV